MEKEHTTAGQIMCTITALSALISIAEVQQLVSIGAGCMAIICGAFTARYYNKKTNQLKDINNETRN